MLTWNVLRPIGQTNTGLNVRYATPVGPNFGLTLVHFRNVLMCNVILFMVQVQLIELNDLHHPLLSSMTTRNCRTTTVGLPPPQGQKGLAFKKAVL